MKRCVVCKKEIQGTNRRMYCGVTCKMKAYWRRKFKNMRSLEEVLTVYNYCLTTEPKLLEDRNAGEVLALLFGSERKVKFEDGVYKLV